MQKIKLTKEQKESIAKEIESQMKELKKAKTDKKDFFKFVLVCSISLLLYLPIRYFPEYALQTTFGISILFPLVYIKGEIDGVREGQRKVMKLLTSTILDID